MCTYFYDFKDIQQHTGVTSAVYKFMIKKKAPQHFFEIFFS